MVTVLVPHVGGPILPPGCPTVLIGGLPAARVTDMATCVGPPDVIVMGSPTVFIGNLMAARIGDPTAHGGVIVLGCFTVIIGEVGVPSAPPVPSLFTSATPPKVPAAAPVPEIPKDCPYLEKPFTVESSKANFDRIRKSAPLGKPKDIKYKFPGDAKEQPALEYEVDTNGHKKKLIMPKNPAKHKSLPTAEQLAAAMGTVPGPQLDKIAQVVASPNPNPDDAYWAKEYKTPNFSSAATGGASGVTFYPQDSWSQQFTDSTMIHEGGHSYSKNLWSDEDKKKAWQKAMSSDGKSPSKYADNSIDEDFSESLVMYSLSKGTGCEATAKQLYPNRYKSLDDLFGAKTP